jgi:hypothetical protein
VTQEELVERIARALAVWYSSDDDDRHWERHTGAAEIALAALSLDDLDTATERAKDWLHESPYNPCNLGSDTCDARRAARGVLEAALTSEQS